MRDDNKNMKQQQMLEQSVMNALRDLRYKHYLFPHSYHVDGDDEGDEGDEYDGDNEYDEDEKSILALCDKALEDIQLAKQDRTHLSKVQDSINEIKRSVGTHMTNVSLEKWARDLDNEGALSRRDKENLAACKKLEDDLKRKRAKLAHILKDEETEELFEEETKESDHETIKNPRCETSGNRKRKATALPRSLSPGCSTSSTSHPSPSKCKRI